MKGEQCTEGLRLEVTQKPNVEDGAEMNQTNAREDNKGIEDTAQGDVHEVCAIEQFRGRSNGLRIEYRDLRISVVQGRAGLESLGLGSA